MNKGAIKEVIEKIASEINNDAYKRQDDRDALASFSYEYVLNRLDEVEKRLNEKIEVLANDLMLTPIQRYILLGDQHSERS